MLVRPFFYFFGAKWMQARRYPAPQYDTIVEPFAGSAGYATRYYDRKIILIDKDPVIAGIWRWLIKVSPSEVRRIPLMGPDDSTEDMKGVCEEARSLVGFRIVVATAVPAKRPGSWMKKKLADPVHTKENCVSWGDTFWCERVRERIASQVEYIRHWKVYEEDYRAAPEIVATWFIDPPYEGPGKSYRHKISDYSSLATWCRSRVGQVIVCEQEGAKWMPFSTLAEVKSTKGKSKEVIWLNRQGGEEESKSVHIDIQNKNADQGEESMPNLPTEMREEVAKARTAGGGVYIQHGDYVFMVKKWFFQKIQDRCIILEMVPVESRKKVVYEGPKKIENEPNPVGSECSSTANFDGLGKQSAPANSRAPVLALFGFKEGEVSDQIVGNTLDEVVGPTQPAAGMLVACSTFPKEIKSKKGEYITGLNWSCVNKPNEGLNAPEMVKARLDAFARGPEELVKLAAEQLTKARASGQAPALASADTWNERMAEKFPAAPSAPAPVAPAIPAAAKDPFEGWTVHPQNPEFFYRGSEVKSKTDLIAGR